MEQWVLLRKGADFEGIAGKFGISRRLASLVRNREVAGEEAIERYLNGSMSDLYDGMLLKDMDRAVEILKAKTEEHKKIRVIGDYDIDGINATYILLEGLERLGADVDSDIPNRMTDGYGLNRELIERAHRELVDTIITCDNGIAAAGEIAYAKELGMSVIVTDHHEIPYEESCSAEDGRKYVLPPADAVIDPKREDCSYPFDRLCGAAVAYKVMEALYIVCGKAPGELDDLIENVAIATVGDVMDLVDENRIFVKEGLKRLRKTSSPGLGALMDCTGIRRERMSAYHIGFVLGPCLNASGRLDTAKRALDLLRSRSKGEADRIAGDLKSLNDDRKAMTLKMAEEAVEQVEHTEAGKNKVLVLYLPECHESLAGIVAGRIREKYYRPVFVITDARVGAKGSGRSIDAYHMYDGLHQCKELLGKYGGHKMAAGFSLEKKHIEALRDRLNRNCSLTEADLTEKVVIDMELPFSCVTPEFIAQLEVLEPFGKGNVKPVFAGRDIELLNARILGKNKNVLKMKVRDAQTQIDAMYFGDLKKVKDVLESRYGSGCFESLLAGRRGGMRMSVTYYPDLNEYMGRVTPQIVVTHCC